jgi:hypothetical protein
MATIKLSSTGASLELHKRLSVLQHSGHKLNTQKGTIIIDDNIFQNAAQNHIDVNVWRVIIK